MGTSATMMRQGKVAKPYMARAACKHNICEKLSLILLTCLTCARLDATVGFRIRLLSVGVYSSSGSCQRWRKGGDLGGSMTFSPAPPCAPWLSGTNRPTRLPEHSRDGLIRVTFTHILLRGHGRLIRICQVIVLQCFVPYRS